MSAALRVTVLLPRLLAALVMLGAVSGCTSGQFNVAQQVVQEQGVNLVFAHKSHRLQTSLQRLLQFNAHAPVMVTILSIEQPSIVSIYSDRAAELERALAIKVRYRLAIGDYQSDIFQARATANFSSFQTQQNRLNAVRAVEVDRLYRDVSGQIRARLIWELSNNLEAHQKAQQPNPDH